MDYMDVEVVQEKATPVQNVFFFKKGTSGHDDVLFILLGWIQNIKFPFKVHLNYKSKGLFYDSITNGNREITLPFKSMKSVSVFKEIY